MSSPPLWGPLKRSSSVLRIPGIQRPGRYPYSTAAAAGRGDGGTAAGVKGTGSSASPDRDIAGFLKAVAGIASAGSGLGLWLALSSNSSPSSSPVASPPDTVVSGFSVADGRADLEEGVEFVADAAGQERKPKYLFGDAYRRKVFFNYEKRIRMLSPPEKVFEYFASFRTQDREVFMTPADLMRAVVPVFPSSESSLVREGYLRGERHPGELHCSPSKLFMLFDTDNDGLISFPEYIFFVTLLSIPESSFTVAFKMFDVDNNGEIEKEEFKKVMALMRSYNRQGACHKDGLRIGLKTSKSVEDGGLVEYFFGREGSGCLQLEKFVEFLRDLHEEILLLEFMHYDCKSRGTISAKDFALSMVASSDISHINKLLDRVEQLENVTHLKDMRFTFEEFKAFAALRSQLQALELALFSYGKVNGLLTKQDFQRAASNVCGIFLTGNVIEVVFQVFDVNQDGNLSSEELLKALHRREIDMRQPASTGITSRWLNCARPSFLLQMLP